ncbi:hypothetical protein [Loigolactobacillus backii]|uniref:Uncharacterized protein n=1 Tax=Loigolactobacillus backii TaxID=375175 RepID=A0A192H126_9LACO|nr:hypothetical protein [Loigolactobacillus backii]ANK60442.1 hypothetical protein AYR52_09360 [Loigolactobacillus backii]ANK62060.1 hypothetical protein AYR53_04330 [Loigolactobacillus backii]ANK65321.1 hypothetical protein AYR54_08765 [Loigolactobacillus backii]ANK67872.1 hypothetical protein AYR55_09325 [Loigolactobacillus backii]ANK68746.1 hypothetical protein AYR56_00395 [Loigolactobacillus backii]
MDKEKDMALINAVVEAVLAPEFTKIRRWLAQHPEPVGDHLKWQVWVGHRRQAIGRYEDKVTNTTAIAIQSVNQLEKQRSIKKDK